MTLHLPHLFAHEQSRQNTLLDLSVLGATGPGIEDALRAVTEQPQPRLVGFRCAADSEAIDDAIALMEQVRRDYGVILTELVLADADRVDLREAVDEAWTRPAPGTGSPARVSCSPGARLFPP